VKKQKDEATVPFFCPRCLQSQMGLIEAGPLLGKDYIVTCPSCKLVIPATIKLDLAGVGEGVQSARWERFKDKYCTFEKPFAYVLTKEGFEVLRKQWNHLFLESWSRENGYAIFFHTRFFRQEPEPVDAFLFHYYVVLGRWKKIDDIKPENTKKVYVARDRVEVDFILRGLFWAE